VILAIDLKSFYASVECALRNLDPFETALVVADKSRGEGSIVLAVTPYLKKRSVPSRLRIFELPTDINITFAKPQMQKYIDYSAMIYEVYLEFISKEDIHVYSIDEAFLDVTSYLKHAKKTAFQMAQAIVKRVLEKTKITATCGVGSNMFLAKIALDLLAKKAPEGIVELTQEFFISEVRKRPVEDFWGIGYRMQIRLNQLGIFTMEDISKTNPLLLEKEFGIIGLEIYEHSYGINDSKISEIKNYKPRNKSIGNGQVLPADYPVREAALIIREMVDVLVLDLIAGRLFCKTIMLSIIYSDKITASGFSRQKTLDYPTDSQKVLQLAFKELFYDFVDDYPIRKIAVRVTNLSSREVIQLSLFQDEKTESKERTLAETILKIKSRYGRDIINKAESSGPKAMQRIRNKQIGGHNE